MRKLILAAAAIGTLGAMSVTADAMPAAGSASVAQPVTANPAIQKTEVVVVKKKRPLVVVKKRPLVVVKKHPVIVKKKPVVVVH